MSDNAAHPNTRITIGGLSIALAMIASSIILAQGALKVVRFNREVITVTGSAQQEIKSDYIVWNCEFSSRSSGLQDAYARLQEDLAKVKTYLTEKEIPEEEITISAVETETVFKRGQGFSETNEVEGYRLRQRIEINSSAVETIAEVSRQSSELINKGIELRSHPPQFFYTKLEDLKVEMLAKATENAKERAVNMAQAAGNRVGPIRSARMGVFQITPVNSTAVSDYGINDTSSLEKKITAVVRVTFAIE